MTYLVSSESLELLILRLPNPRPVEMITNAGIKYDYEDFKHLIIHGDTKEDSVNREFDATTPIPEIIDKPFDSNSIDIESLPISPKIKSLILHGNDGSYISRSETDMAVITVLVNRGIGDDVIKQIFKIYPIGEKYRAALSSEKYLAHSIKKGKEFSILTEEEIEDPLFLSGSLHKTEKRYTLKIVKFEEYITRKYTIKVLDREEAFCKYNGKCYEHISDESLNMLCQRELQDHRDLFTKSSLNELIHYAIGDAFLDSEKAHQDEINYLTLQNGLYKLDEGRIIPHTPAIFTTNLLPYDYNPDAQCPRFIQFLDEIFLGDKDIIEFVHQAVGYAFHKSIPTPAIFFLIGGGSNGKSVFINTIANLVGKNNTSNVSFNKLSNEYYVLDLFQKMINISGETPNQKITTTDIAKQIVAGDWVTGREPYKRVTKFRPYAKHYLAMNKLPQILDNSYGMDRRLFFIQFPRTFKGDEIDPNLENKLSLELSGIFNWAIEGYNQLRENDFKLPKVSSMTIAKEEYRNELDGIRSFAKSLLKSDDPADKVKFKDAYERYALFCGKWKMDLEHRKEFRKILEELGFKIENSTKDSNQLYIFNARLVPEEEMDEE